MTTIQQHRTQQPTNQQPIDATQQGIKTTRQQDSMTTRQQRNNPTAQQPTTQQPTNQLMRDSSTATQQPNNPTTKNPTTHQPLDAARRNARSDPPPPSKRGARRAKLGIRFFSSAVPLLAFHILAQIICKSCLEISNPLL